MISRTRFLRSCAAAALVLGSLAGCGQMRPSSKIDIYQASLSPSQEVPPVTSPASGTAELMLNSNTNTLSWKVNYSGLTGAATAAHIHGPAAMGSNAGVVVPFSGDLNAQPMTGSAVLSPQQVSELATGLWYINIHTARFPGGEIRGQLMPRR